MLPQTASDGISQERFEGGSPSFTQLSGTIGRTHLLDMTSLVASGRMQNAIKYCTKMMRKTGPADQRVKWFGYCLTQTRQMLYEHPCRSSLPSHLIWGHQLFPIGIYQSSKNGRKWSLRLLWVKLECCGVLPAPPIGGLLVILFLLFLAAYPLLIRINDSSRGEYRGN